MKHIFVSIFALAIATLTATALTAPEQAPAEASAFTADYAMPSLAEMLGEDIDDFGDINFNAAIQSSLVDYAKQYIGTRYRRGAKGPSAFDCSGFTSYVFRNFGYSLSPSSSMQGTQGERISMDEIEPGDLMFFTGRRGGNNVGHVGMVVDVNRETGTVKFIHASTSKGVVIDTYPDGGYYSRRFLHARRVLSDDMASPLANN